MRIERKKVNDCCIKFSIKDTRGKEIGKAYLYMLANDEHEDPFGIINEISLREHAIKNGVAERFIQKIKDEALGSGCYRLTVISEDYKRAVNKQLKKSGFGGHGTEYRLDL